MSNQRTAAQLANIVTRSTKEHHLEIARKWGIPAIVVANATFELGVTMMVESGHSEEQIIEIVRQLVANLALPPHLRGAP